MPETDVPLLAVVVYEPGWDVEPLLTEVHARLTGELGLTVGGVLPDTLPPAAEGLRKTMTVVDLTTGEAVVISQDLGGGADACVLDPDGLTRSRFAIDRAVEAGVDLVLAGKFAKQEAAGGGAREEIARAVVEGLPTLVVMRATQSEAFEAFAGPDHARLPAEVEPILAWARAVTGRG